MIFKLYISTNRLDNIWDYISDNMRIYEGKQIIEGSLEVKLPRIWTDEKQRRKSDEKVCENKLVGDLEYFFIFPYIGNNHLN